jgi:alpha-L-fucosidase
MQYDATWNSINSRPVPEWFSDAKFGVFIHWGVYSVPAWAPKGTYSEWYWDAMLDRKLTVEPHADAVANAPTEHEPSIWGKHVALYGEDAPYQDFAPQFKAEMFDPDRWAKTIERSGAKYVILTSKHHDGFCLWPSQHAWNWNSVDIGPHRDLLGDLTESVRARGITMGYYYSLYEWFNPLYLENPERYSLEHMHPQFKDLVERYEPALIYSDGEWDHPEETWHSAELLAWLYNESAVRENVVVNDRWGTDSRSKNGGYFTTEYGEVGEGKSLVEGKPWEEIRGIGASFGFNRNEMLDDYMSTRDLVLLLVDTVSKGGNLCLNVGPTADGRIPVIQEERLAQVGDWLGVNGAAIYGSSKWRAISEGVSVRYTSTPDAVYAISIGWPGDELILREPKPGRETHIELLGHDERLEWTESNGSLVIKVPRLAPDAVPGQYAYTFKLSGVV